jgi:hypothetical protein
MLSFYISLCLLSFPLENLIDINWAFALQGKSKHSSILFRELLVKDWNRESIGQIPKAQVLKYNISWGYNHGGGVEDGSQCIARNHRPKTSAGDSVALMKLTICKVIPAIMNQDNVGVQRRICSQQLLKRMTFICKVLCCYILHLPQ